MSWQKGTLGLQSGKVPLRIVQVSTNIHCLIALLSHCRLSHGPIGSLSQCPLRHWPLSTCPLFTCPLSHCPMSHCPLAPLCPTVTLSQNPIVPRCIVPLACSPISSVPMSHCPWPHGELCDRRLCAFDAVWQSATKLRTRLTIPSLMSWATHQLAKPWAFQQEGLRGRSSPVFTLSQNGYGDQRAKAMKYTFPRSLI